MKVLITGASGYLGQHLLEALMSSNHTLIGAFGGLETFTEDYPTVDARLTDIADSAAVAALMTDVQPDCVVHLAAVSSPAACERDPDRSHAVNVPMALIEALPPNATFIFLSTDQVYDGLKGSLYSESDITEPVNGYGAAKLAFEKALRTALPERSVALRSSLILGPTTPGRCRKQSFLQFCDERLSSGTPTDFFSDEFRSVLAVDDIVATLRWFIDKGNLRRHPGVYNMGGPERLSRVDVAHAVASCRGHTANAVIRAVPRAEVVTGGPNSPPDICMDSSKLSAVTGINMRPLAEIVLASFPPPPP